MSVRAFYLLLCAIIPASAYSQENRSERAAYEFVSELEGITYEQCRFEYAERLERYIDNNAEAIDTLAHILEANRISCESSRLRGEVTRLQTEKTRLIAEVGRIEDSWQRSHASDPDKFPDLSGRDRSQKLIHADVAAIDFTINQINKTRNNLTFEAIRLISLSQKDFDVAGHLEKEYILLAIDSEARHSIFDRFREAKPRQS